jgi:tetratricopeptide (TPR) repeat protein
MALIMKKTFYTKLISIIFIIIIFSSPVAAYDVNRELRDSFKTHDYAKATKLLEKQIIEIKNDNGIIYRSYFALAYLYFWRLNDADKALTKLQEFSVWKVNIKDISKMPSLENLYRADIYDKINDVQKSQHYYELILNDLIAAQRQDKGTDGNAMISEMIKFISFKIDNLNLRTAKKETQSLKKIRLSSRYLKSKFLSFLMMSFVPDSEFRMYELDAEYNQYPKAPPPLAEFISKSINDFGSILANCSMIVDRAEKSYDEAYQAMEVFIAKYPDNYYTPSLVYLFYKYYSKNGQQEKARQLKLILEKIGQQQQIEIITEADPRFSSPEITGGIYKSALRDGNVELALECFTPDTMPAYKKLLDRLGKDKWKAMGMEKDRIEEVRRSENEAVYGIIVERDGKLTSYQLKFVNDGGNWKILSF